MVAGGHPYTRPSNAAGFTGQASEPSPSGNAGSTIGGLIRTAAAATIERLRD